MVQTFRLDLKRTGRVRKLDQKLRVRKNIVFHARLKRDTSAALRPRPDKRCTCVEETTKVASCGLWSSRMRSLCLAFFALMHMHSAENLKTQALLRAAARICKDTAGAWKPLVGQRGPAIKFYEILEVLACIDGPYNARRHARANEQASQKASKPLYFCTAASMFPLLIL